MRKRWERKRRERDEKLSQALRIVENEIKIPEENDFEDMNEPFPRNTVVDWENVPEALNPSTKLLTKLKKRGRALRKQQQLESLVYHIKRLYPYIDASIDIVEFGCGQGHVGLLIAHLYTNARVTLLDFNPEKLKMIKARIRDVNSESFAKRILLLSSMKDIENRKTFDLGIGLHCCGPFTDSVISFCKSKNADFVVSPCCYGKIKFELPFSKNKVSQDWIEAWKSLIRGADFNVGNADTFDPSTNDRFIRAKRCMNIVDNGIRAQYWKRENKKSSYVTTVHSMRPLSCTPKNNIVVGQRKTRKDLCDAKRIESVANNIQACSLDVSSMESTLLQVRLNLRGLDVRLSTIGPVAGFGLFTRRSFRVGEVICVYEGNFYRTKDAIRLKNKSYLMRLGPQCYVDALNRRDVPARYINDCRNPLLHNVYFDKRPEDRVAYVTALRSIYTGEELFVDYGKRYWAGCDLKPKRLFRLPHGYSSSTPTKK